MPSPAGKWNQHLHKACQQKEAWSALKFPRRWLRWLWTSENKVDQHQQMTWQPKSSLTVETSHWTSSNMDSVPLHSSSRLWDLDFQMKCKIYFHLVVNFFLVEAETRRLWDIFQAEVTLYWELAVRRCSHPSLTIAQHSRVYTFQGGGIHRGGDNLNKACKCSTGISPLPEFPQPWPHQHNSVIQMHRC